VSVAGASSPHNAGNSSAPLLEIRDIAKRFGHAEVLKNISLQIAPGEFLTLLGESGSGKTTLLRLIAGFEQPTSGQIWMSGERLDTLPPYRRRGLRVKSTPKSEIASRVDDALGMVKMRDFAEARPATLSGGQQQRIALARALINRPELLLLDEPLSALDANLRKQMQSELKILQREIGIAFLFVTHDQDEAMALSDRIALLRNGALEQVAAPREIYSHPATAYAAQFIGQTNLLRGEVRGDCATCGAIRICPVNGPDGPATFSLRPEAIKGALDATIGTPYMTFKARIRQQIYAGATELLEVDCAGQLLRVRVPAGVSLDGEHEFIFSPRDAVRIRD
jgi:ABC-type Fe3+/spermidine/putrescine transport system ATPase subunit